VQNINSKIAKRDKYYLTHNVFSTDINPLKTKRTPLYLKTQSVPRCKHLLSRL